MLENKLVVDIENLLGFKNIKIDSINKVEDYLFIKLDNGQNVLTNGKELYDVSGYSHLISMFNMGDKSCAVFIKKFSTCVVD